MVIRPHNNSEEPNILVKLWHRMTGKKSSPSIAMEKVATTHMTSTDTELASFTATVIREKDSTIGKTEGIAAARFPSRSLASKSHDVFYNLVSLEYIKNFNPKEGEITDDKYKDLGTHIESINGNSQLLEGRDLKVKYGVLQCFLNARKGQPNENQLIVQDYVNWKKALTYISDFDVGRAIEEPTLTELNENLIIIEATCKKVGFGMFDRVGYGKYSILKRFNDVFKSNNSIDCWNSLQLYCQSLKQENRKYDEDPTRFYTNYKNLSGIIIDNIAKKASSDPELLAIIKEQRYNIFPVIQQIYEKVGHMNLS